MVGNLSNYFRFSVGSELIVAKVDEELVILNVYVDKCSDTYKYTIVGQKSLRNLIVRHFYV